MVVSLRPIYTSGSSEVNKLAEMGSIGLAGFATGEVEMMALG